MGGWGGGWLLNGRLGAVQVKVLGGTFHLLALAPVPALPEVCFRGRLVPPPGGVHGPPATGCPGPSTPPRSPPALTLARCHSPVTVSVGLFPRAPPAQSSTTRDVTGRAGLRCLLSSHSSSSTPSLFLVTTTTKPSSPPEPTSKRESWKGPPRQFLFPFLFSPSPSPRLFLFLPDRPPLRYPPPSSHSALVFFGRSTLHASLLSLRFDGSHSPDTHESRRPSAALALTPPCPTSPTSARSP